MLLEPAKELALGEVLVIKNFFLMAQMLLITY